MSGSEVLQGSEGGAMQRVSGGIAITIASLGLIGAGFFAGQWWPLPEERLAARLVAARSAYHRCRAQVPRPISESEKRVERLSFDVRYGIRRPESLTPAEAIAFDLDRETVTFDQLNDAGQNLIREKFPHLADDARAIRARCATESAALDRATWAIRMRTPASR
jgi:hypothetical protein